MPKYRVTLRRIVYAEVIVEADSAKDARTQVAEVPDEWFVMSDNIDTDIATVFSVKREDK